MKAPTHLNGEVPTLDPAHSSSDNIPGWVFKECLEQLAYVLKDMFNRSLLPPSHDSLLFAS